MSPKDLINGQRLERGLPPIDRVKQDIQAGNGPSEFQQMSFRKDIRNQHEGMRELRSLGFPTRGAAYLSSAIMHESNWHGTRQWGEVAGDGTNRNGGLLSWASWAGNSARLGAIERYFGRPITQITEPEQLQFMHHELRTHTPNRMQCLRTPMHLSKIYNGLLITTSAGTRTTPVADTLLLSNLSVGVVQTQNLTRHPLGPGVSRTSLETLVPHLQANTWM